MKVVMKLFDYEGGLTERVINLDEVKRIDIDVISGDELADIQWKDGSRNTCYDSSNSRVIDYFDWSYPVFDPANGINLFEEDAWLLRDETWCSF